MTDVDPQDRLGLLGQTIGEKYRVERLIGEGGAGVVYQGHNLLLGERVAIKCIKPDEGGAATNERGFIKEAKLLFTLSHPGIVRMYDVGELGTPRGRIPYVVLEYIEGASLEDDIKARQREQRAHTREEIDAVMIAVLEAVAFAHERQVVHRDLKPSNVMLVPGGAKVLDFGTARSGDQATRLTSHFTPRYAAPEQWDPSRGERGAWTDVYALGLLLYEMAVLEPAMAGSDVPSLIEATMRPERPSLKERRPDLSPAFDVILRKATAVNPKDRFRDARELLIAFKSAPRLTAALRVDGRMDTAARRALASTAPLSGERPNLASTAFMPGRPSAELTPSGTLPLSQSGGAQAALRRAEARVATAQMPERRMTPAAHVPSVATPMPHQPGTAATAARPLPSGPPSSPPASYPSSGAPNWSGAPAMPARITPTATVPPSAWPASVDPLTGSVVRAPARGKGRGLWVGIVIFLLAVAGVGLAFWWRRH